MIKRSLLVENKTVITTKNLQLVLKSEIRESTIPIEDIGFLVIDHGETYLSIPAMNLLIENNTAIIVCGNNHLPNGMFLNLNSHHIQQEIFKNQIDASVPLKKQLWQNTIVEKIINQGILLEKITGNKNSFPFLAGKVLSGDSTNMEGVAASQYWKSFFEIDFKRERFGDYPNNFLNYGYAILKATTRMALLFTLSDKTLKKMDSLARMLRYSNPDFFNLYFKSRKIGKPGYRTISLQGTVTNTDGNPIQKAEITIGDNQIGRYTSPKGAFEVKNLKTGIYTVAITIAGYQQTSVQVAVTAATQRSQITITLVPDNNSIEDVA